MKIINREMHSGKTHALIEIMLAPGNSDVYYVAPTYKQADHAAKVAKSISPRVDRNRFVSVAALNAFRQPTPRFVLDEVEGVLNTLLQGKVLAVAGTDEDLKDGQMRRIRGER